MADVKDEIDKISRESGFGALTEAAANTIFGINHRGVGNPVPYNTENQGLVFFTRPNLNLSYDNLANDRILSTMLTEAQNTYQRVIRTLLDPVGAFGRPATQTRPLGLVGTQLVDPKLPFIGILTNHCLSLRGWPDPQLQYYSSKPGPHKELWSMIDDAIHYFGEFTLTGSFRNVAGDPITLLFNVWLRYMSLVYEGVMTPYPECIIENEIDYQTRIYRVTLDRTRSYVQKIAAANACFPTAVPLGAAMDFSTDHPMNTDTANQISVPLQCIGCEYNDPILIEEFNDIVAIFNPDMADSNRPSAMHQLSRDELNYYNYYGYPRIDPNTNEMQWWVGLDDYFSAQAGG